MQVAFEGVEHGVPGNGLGGEAGGGAEAGAAGGIGGKGDGVVEKGDGIVEGRDEAVYVVSNVAGSGGVVKGEHGQAAGHRFGEHVAKGLGEAGVKEQIGRGVVAGEISTGEEAGEDGVGPLAAELFARGTVAHDDKVGGGESGLDAIEGGKEERVVFFGGEPANVHDDKIRGSGAPGGA